jgi:hypothetical protein
MTRPNVFLYRRGCKICYEALAEVAPFMANRQLPLVIETIQGTLIKEIPYVPALLLRKSAFNTEQEVVIMGRHMLTQLQTLEAATLEVADE